jgi:AcrR family transcriptional regulator
MNRDDILEAAALIFSQKGFHAASMQDIAQAVNLQKASLYYHVSSKQEILLALLNRALDLLIEDIEGVIAQPLPPAERLQAAMEAYLSDMLENRELASILLLEHRSLDPDQHTLHVQRRDRFERLWRDMVDDGVEQGVFSTSDPGLVARALLGVMNWTITWYKPDGPLGPTQIACEFSDLFLKGLLAREGASHGR